MTTCDLSCLRFPLQAAIALTRVLSASSRHHKKLGCLKGYLVNQSGEIIDK